MLMNNADEKSVFFIKDLTVEQEIALVKRPITKKDENIPKRVKGNNLLHKKVDLLQNVDFDFEAVKIGPSVNYDLESILIIALLSLEPFYNLIKTFNERVGRNDLKIISLIYDIIVKNKAKDLDLREMDVKFGAMRYKDQINDQGKDLDVFEVLKDLLQLLHDEFLKKHFYEEDDWENPNDKKIARIRGYFNDFSPIRDLFCGEIRNNVDPKFIKDFFHLKITEKTTVQAGINERIASFANRVCQKSPAILAIFCKNIRQPESDFKIDDDWYSLKSIITLTEKGYNLYIRGDKITSYSNGEIKILNLDEGIKGETQVAFYRKNRVRITH